MADLIVVLDGARLVEVGTHEELMAKSGQYAELYSIQAPPIAIYFPFPTPPPSLQWVCRLRLHQRASCPAGWWGANRLAILPHVLFGFSLLVHDLHRASTKAMITRG